MVTWSFASGVLDHFYPEWSEAQRWLAGAYVALVFFLSVLAHELSHAIVSNASGLPVRSITLFVFGGVANLSREPDSPGTEFRIAIVGPLTSLGLGALFAGAWAALAPFNDGLAGICANLALINTSLAIFNMLPGFPLDGGRVFRSLVWSRNRNRLNATRTASRVGEWLAYGVMAIGLLSAYAGEFFGGLWLLMIGFFLRNAAAQSYQQLVIDDMFQGVTVKDVMRADVPTMAPDDTVLHMVEDGVLRQHSRCFAVVAAGDFAGLITLTDARKVPREDWATTSVFRAMTPVTALHTVGPSDGVMAVLRLMAEHDVNQLPVVQGRTLVGILDRGDVMRYIEVKRDLGTLDSSAKPDEARRLRA